MIRLFRLNRVYIIVVTILLLDLIYAPKGGDSSRLIPLLFKISIIVLGFLEFLHSKRIRIYGRFVSVLIALFLFLACSTFFVSHDYFLLRFTNLIKLII